ncbi:glycoside hydrolase [Pseudovirgaria hyperparasitica]|uniref:Glycoside hydrolase n=1 Tax=Pseudovirgaria hyperparasitica TaxID=470096 RepID=A0A6A6WCZ0_9PEZI|nr:glycoside hydrolase [Pseudovirgaria hyperparasitica]KAF2759830.1 glycoside hydrolase [Pseudovirgaria hyperparasitica]
MITARIIAAACLVSLTVAANIHSPSFRFAHRDTSTNRTSDTDSLKTWWHDNGEVNTKTVVLDSNVRQSHLYSVQVSTADADDYYDSFVYESIPRSGKGQICYPGNYEDICPEYDGISIEAEVGITMGWTQFLYGSDVKVKVTRKDGSPINSTDEVTIRPSNRAYELTTDDGSVYVTVPYTPETNGVRFSIEFADDVWEYRKGDTGYDYVQNLLSSALAFVSTFTSSNPIVGREPRNSLLIFASPFPTDDLIPADSDDVYNATPGWVNGLESIEHKVVSFGPGVYYFNGDGYANLSHTVEWVYFAPGSYVKGAIQYNAPDVALKATGFGVLSGEQYVYQANPASNWSNNKSDATSIKMWRGNGITAGQSWLLHGITTANPPFNAMDFYDATESFTVEVADYKQVGGFYSQTDGLQMYPGSYLHDIFYHTGDDTLKVYHSNVRATGIVAWKTNNAPLIQLGWYPRTVSNVTLAHIAVIHSRYSSSLAYAPRALIGSSSAYSDLHATDTANTSCSLANITISDLRAEGISPALLGLNMLANLDSFLVDGVFIEELPPPVTYLDVANVTGFTDAEGEKVALGADSADTGGMGLTIRAFKVGNESVSFAKGNWDLDGLGRVNVDESYWGKWTILDADEDDDGSDDGDGDTGDGDGDADDDESLACRGLKNPRMMLGPPAALAVGVGYLATN